MWMMEEKKEKKEKDMLRKKSNNPNLKGGEECKIVGERKEAPRVFVYFARPYQL